jgi:hypothetical protein
MGLTINLSTVEGGYGDLIHYMIKEGYKKRDGQYGASDKFTIWLNDVTVVIPEPTGAINLGSVGYSVRRWEKFLRNYVDYPTMQEFLLKPATMYGYQEISMLFATKARHTVGNCLMGMTLNMGKKPRLTLISRSSQLVPMGALDMSLAALVCQYIQAVTKKLPALRWVLPQLQLQDWETVAYILYEHPEWVGELSREDRFQSSLLDKIEWAKINHNPNEKYIFYRRMLARIREAQTRMAAGQGPALHIPYLPPDVMPSGRFVMGAPPRTSSITIVDEDEAETFEEETADEEEMGEEEME